MTGDIAGHRNEGDGRYGPETADVDGIPAMRKRSPGNQVVDIIAGDLHIVHSSVGAGRVVARPDPER